MTYPILYYLGPEHTFSYTAANSIKTKYPEWHQAILTPCKTADEMFHHLQIDDTVGAVVPVFNLEQGTIHDFTRFYLFQAQLEEKLVIDLALFSQSSSLKYVRKLVTKDTVIPQISRWVETLPPHIEIEATPYISTSTSAYRASLEPNTAAICAPAAGRIYPNLRLLESNLSNNPQSYTLFKLFVRPSDFWHNPTFFPTPEQPYNFNDRLATRLRDGECTVLWHKSAHTKLHLGHYSNLLTLRKFAHWGNKIHISIDISQTTAIEALQKGINRFFGHIQAVTYHLSAQREGLPTADVEVAGIEHIHSYANGKPAVLVDTLSGTDGYAKMASARNNTMPWFPIPDLLQLPDHITAHFSPQRLASAGFSL